MSVQRRKTEMVGSLVVDADTMSKEAATPKPTKEVVTHAVENFGEDLKRSVNLQKRKTEMYGTLIVDTMEEATSGGSANPPDPSSPGRKPSKWNQPMDEEMIEDMEDFLFGL